MDTLAHGLWGGAVFGQKRKGQWKWAFLLGIAPDFFSFGLFFLTHLSWVYERWVTGTRGGPPDPSIVPAFVYHAYDVTHSLVVWGGVMAILWFVLSRRRPGESSTLLFPVFAWPLHILCDIPTHSTRFFPTPYLWPFSTPFVDGRPWSLPPFQMINYTLIALAYFGVWLYHRRSKAYPTPGSPGRSF